MDEPIRLALRRAKGLPLVLQIGVFSVGYWVAARVGLTLTSYSNDATVVLPAGGVALGALILFGRRLWPGVFLGALMIRLVDPRSTWIAYGLIAVGSTLGAWVGATLLARVKGFQPNLGTPRSVATFLLIGVFGCTLVNPTIGVSSLILVGDPRLPDPFSLWLVWWLSNACGVLVVTPLLLMVAYGTPRWATLLQSPEFWMILSILLATASLVFLASIPGVPGIILLLAPFPLLVWAGTTLGSRGATLASFVIIATATVSTVVGAGPLISARHTDEMLLLSAYSALIGLTAFSLAAVTEQRNAAAQRHERELSDRLQIEKEKLLLLERERLTREMHDGLGGQLVSLLSMVERGVGSKQEISEALRRTLDDIRIVIDSLDPDTTDLPTALAKLRSRLEPLLRRNGIELAWQIDDDPRMERFSPDGVLHLLRIIQEGVTNVIRHAQATRVEVRVATSSSGRLQVSIQDDGRGLPKDRTVDGRGIASMRARSLTLGAMFRVDSTDSGTQIAIDLPLPVSPSIPT